MAKIQNQHVRTVYADVVFRSRLEARWAAFFDLMNWRWTYEPLDLHDWSPTFALHGHRTILVEVTQTFGTDQRLARRLSLTAHDAGNGDEILIVGPCMKMPQYWDGISLGWFGESNEHGHEWSHAIMHTGGPQVGFCSEVHSYQNRISGFHDGDRGAGDHSITPEILRRWRMAGNVTQRPSWTLLAA